MCRHVATVAQNMNLLGVSQFYPGITAVKRKICDHIGHQKTGFNSGVAR